MHTEASATPPVHRLAYEGFSPEWAGPPRAAHAGHALVGRLSLGRSAWLGAGSVIRADGHFVRVGAGLALGRGATVHIAHERHPTVMGEQVCVGANAVIHACTVGDGCVIEEDCVILDGAELGEGAVLEAGSIVFPRSRLEGGWLHGGRPARPLRPLNPGETGERCARLRERIESAPQDWPAPGAPTSVAADVFVADTASLAGEVHLHTGSSVWFGCRLDGRGAPIEIGARCNVQDNAVLLAARAAVRIGEGTTIGHNVELVDCLIGQRCLVGIGSRIAPGTEVADDTFLAAGSVTLPGQRLEGGRLWAGCPARAIAELDEAKRLIVQATAHTYGEYARRMRQA